MYSIGVDLGGTKILTGVLDEQGTLHHTLEVPTMATDGPDAVIHRIRGTVDQMLHRVGHANVIGIGIGAPGPLNPHTGTVLGPPNLPGWDHIPLRDKLHEVYGLPVYLENDANAAAIAEHRFGAGQGSRQMVYITVSTGIGGGVVVDGQVRQGAAGGFAEIGHMIVDPAGARCHCGNRGCLEAVASGTAIARMASEAFRRDLTAEQVAELAARGDKKARQVLDTAFSYLGIGLVNIVNLYDPDLIVIGGGVARIGPPLFDALHEAVLHNYFRQSYGMDVPIVPAHLGTKAGVIGAAALPWLACRTAVDSHPC
ncbi:ROK family protein [Alicyclobacillus shizuokensis]|uniref:ROK family protein n=1 Tax=Alicyclobacillus shizuokensis TaxID=392014 RepID=UPI0008360E3F|nr:ROK family protein [Alicyclobacillus shizuokensis]MCL6625891.1 ROK family protein [Alicyclobacillus shizuokensis]